MHRASTSVRGSVPIVVATLTMACLGVRMAGSRGRGPGTPPASGPATSATAGVFARDLAAGIGSTPPATVAALQGGTPNAVTANPSTPWTAGQHVQTATAGAAGRAGMDRVFVGRRCC